MGMNPDTNELEKLKAVFGSLDKRKESGVGAPVLLRPNGEPVPEHWSIFVQGEDVVIKNYTFRVVYMNEKTIVLEPVGPIIVGED
jgi:hypothetical protein